MSEPIRFLATLAGTNTAARWLSVGSDGSGKMTLEFDAQQLASVLRLATAGGKLLRITAEPE